MVRAAGSLAGPAPRTADEGERARPARAPALVAGIGLVVLGLVAAGQVQAGEADVLEADLITAGDGTFRLDATIRHADTGWDHYADAFQAVTPGGEVIGTRTLLHPHVDEQPFTRSLTGVIIPDGIDQIVVRAHDSVHGRGGAEVRLTVPR